MNDFEQSQWTNTAFAQEYLDNADHYIPDRHYLFHVLRSFYRTFIARPGGAGARVCDLGCGDGVVAGQLLQEDPGIQATLVDGSEKMLEEARQSQAGRPNVTFLQIGFAELIGDSSALGSFDFIISSFALHHLHRSERRAIFGVVRQHLVPGGHFMNIDVVLPGEVSHAEWHYELWREWILRHGARAGLGDKFAGVPQKARENPDNKYSRLDEQLADLRDAGFSEVECHYRNGCFAIYSARRPAEPPRR
jgi:tRNA (cmo5U34)-methyltransferase